MKLSLEELRTRLHGKSSIGQPIIFKRITPELAVSPRELASADLLLIDHTSSAPNRNPVADLLPLADANHELLKNAELFQEVLRRHNVIAGVCGSDPFRLPEKLLEQIQSLGFVGVQNTPSIGMIDGTFREHLENSHISYTQEVTMLTIAMKLGFLALGTVFSEPNAKQMIAAGIEALVIHPGAKALPARPTAEKGLLLEQCIRKACGSEASRLMLLHLPSVSTHQ